MARKTNSFANQYLLYKNCLKDYFLKCNICITLNDLKNVLKDFNILLKNDLSLQRLTRFHRLLKLSI